MSMTVRELVQNAAHQTYEAFYDFLAANRHAGQGVAVSEVLREKYFGDISPMLKSPAFSGTIIDKAFFLSRRLRAQFMTASTKDTSEKNRITHLCQKLVRGLNRYNEAIAKDDEVGRLRGLELVKEALSPFVDKVAPLPTCPPKSRLAAWLERIGAPV